MEPSSWLLAAGVVIGLGWVVTRAPTRASVRVIDEGLCLLVGSLIGSRLGHVFTHWPYYRVQWGEIPRVWLGGLSAAGALAGGVAALFLLAALTRQPAGLMADRLLPLGFMVTMAGWMAGWLSEGGYNPIVDGAWWGITLRDESVQVTSRVPIQLVEAAFSLGVFWFLDKLRLPEKDALPRAQGRRAALWFLTISLQLLVLAFVRTDAGLTWNGLRINALAALGLVSLAVALAGIVYWPIRARTKG